MRRRFFKPLIDFSDQFFFPSLFSFNRPLSIQFRPPKNQFNRQLKEAKEHKIDPQQVFNNFFNENEIKENEEKQFFKKHYPEKIQEKIDPYKVLQVSKDASEDQIKQAYRKLSIKYHPKNDSSPEAKTKFAQLARAYEQAMQAKNQSKFSDLGVQSFFQDFDKKIDEIFTSTTKDMTKKLESNKQVKQGGQKLQEDPARFGQLYSQSTYVENENGKQTRFVAEKKYKKDDTTLSVKRQQTLKDDGQTQILETIDDGKEIKKKHYMLDKDKKETKKLE